MENDFLLGFDSVWVADDLNNRVLRIDPTTGEFSADTSIEPRMVLVGGDHIGVIGRTPTEEEAIDGLYRLDPSTLQISGQITSPPCTLCGGEGPRSIAFGNGHLWVWFFGGPASGQDDYVLQPDPESLNTDNRMGGDAIQGKSWVEFVGEDMWMMGGGLPPRPRYPGFHFHRADPGQMTHSSGAP